MKKAILAVVLILLGITAAYLVYEKRTGAPATQVSPIASEEEKDDAVEPKNNDDAKVCPAIAAAGRYVDYSQDILNKECSGYSRTILFFYAPWCPECRGFEKAIKSSEVPPGTQILKVDYDSSTELKKKYGVTIQTTFVRVDDNGEKIKLWTGYGKEKSINLILENT